MSPNAGHGAPRDDELDPDEPRTPLWLPLLGLCLFVGALVYFLVGQRSSPEQASAPEPAAAPSGTAAPE